MEPSVRPAATPLDEQDPPLLKCMDVWGGNQAIEQSVALTGLDVWVFSLPHRGSLGGDIHYVSTCATGRINRLLVADVSGHGEHVAATARQLHDLMRRFVNRIDQSAFVRSLNREFAAVSESHRFATAVVTTFWAPNAALEISNAGHPRPLWYRAREQRWELIDSEAPAVAGVANVPLGVLERTQYSARHLTLEPEDQVLIYTDSLIEAQSPGGEMLGEQGLIEMVRRLPPLPPAALLRTVHELARAYRGGAAPDDDETLLLFRRNRRAPPWTTAEKVRSVLRGVRGLAASLMPGGPPFSWPDFQLANIGGFFLARFNRYWGKPGR
jgi:serine phosphatase RsbU (regulator of sigma subunit)